MKSLASNVGWWAAVHGFRMVVNFAVGFWVIRYLGTSAFGDLCIVRAIQLILDVVATMGLTQYLPIRYAARPNETARLMATALLVRFGFALAAGAICIPLLVAIRGYTLDDSAILLIAAAFLLISPLQLFETWFISQGKMRIVSSSRMVSIVVTAVMQVCAISLGLGVLTFLAIDLVAVVVFGGLMLASLLMYHRPHGPAATEFAAVAGLARASTPVGLAAIAAIISVRIDQVMLALMIGESATGVYSASARLSEFWIFVPVAIISNVVPKLTRQFETDTDGYHRNALRISSALTSFSIAVAIGTTLVADPLVLWLFGPEFSLAGSVLKIHVWSLPFFALGYLSHNLRIIQGQQIALLPRAVAGACSNVLLNVVLIPFYGIHGAAIATMLSYVIGGTAWDLIVDRSYGLGRIQAKSFLPTYWVSAAMFVVRRFRAVRRVSVPG